MNKTVGSLLKKYRIRPNKKLGQNFLHDPNILEKLIDRLELYPDEAILEIGSGLGLLSYKIARGAMEVLAIEKDKRLLNIAKEEFGTQENLKFLHADFLKLNLKEILKPYHLPIKVIGNIPYNVSSPILFKLLENRSLFQFALLTLQKEVANRLIAPVGTKDYGILTIFLAIHTRCEKLFDIEPGSFIPPPQVVSTTVKISFLEKSPFAIYNPALFNKVVKMAFQQRRKTIRNTLKAILKNGRIKPWEACNIDPEWRPEQIKVEQYVGLANYLNNLL